MEHCHGCRDQGVGAETSLVGRAVECDQYVVDALVIAPLTLPTAVITSAPPNRLPPSRRSTASPLPVEAPAGAIARPTAPPVSVTSASTVGLSLIHISEP